METPDSISIERISTLFKLCALKNARGLSILHPVSGFSHEICPGPATRIQFQDLPDSTALLILLSSAKLARDSPRAPGCTAAVFLLWGLPSGMPSLEVLCLTRPAARGSHLSRAIEKEL